MKALLDTCVVIDLLQKREPFFESSRKLFLCIANKQVEGCITANSVTDIYYIMHKYGHSTNVARKSLETLFKLVRIVDTTGTDCRKANLSSIVDYEDAVMIETAVRERMDIIVTRNIQDYSNSPIRVFTPEQALENLLF